MSLYVMGDLHLSTQVQKPMDVFGGVWDGYQEKIIQSLSKLNDDDVIVLNGDTSWAMSLNEALSDFKLLDSFKGQKIVSKGNHDFWWTTKSKVMDFFEQNDIHSIDILHNNCFVYNDTAICGTKGYFYEETKSDSHDLKVYKRELLRLEHSLSEAERKNVKNKIVFLHYPPIYQDIVYAEMLDIMNRYGVSECYYGHIHGMSHKYAFNGIKDGIKYTLVSSDFLNFKPYKIF